MERGLYIAASGMAAEMVRQDLIANDLANATTPGYKQDRAAQASFGQILLANTSTGQPIGPLGFGPRIDRVVTDTSPSGIRETGEALDFAIAGDGWFAVRTDGGIRYTRNGRFTVSAQGTLVTAQGDQVLSQNGGAIRVARGGKVDPRDLGVFAVDNPVKEGESLFAGAAAGRASGTVRAGALEGSGVQPARAMVDMIGSLRAFEATQRVITTIDETLNRAAGIAQT